MEYTGERYIPGTIADSWLTGKEHWQRYLYAAQFVVGKEVLDIASGEGYGSNYLAQTAKRVYGVDISKEAVEHASGHYIKENLEFLAGSIDNIPLGEQSVDVIVSYETLEHVEATTQIGFLNEVKRVLRPGGVLIISCPNKAIATDRAFKLWGFVNEYHLKEFYIDEFRDFLESKFKHVNITHQRSEFVQVINNSNTKYLDIVLSDKKDYTDTQNIIAICSELPLELSDRGSIVLDTDFLYLQRDKQLCELNRANEQHISQLNEVNNELISIQQKLLVALEERENIEQVNQALIKDLSILQQKGAEDKRVIKQLNDQVTTILKSHSWQITAPIRHLVDVLRKR